MIKLSTGELIDIKKLSYISNVRNFDEYYKLEYVVDGVMLHFCFSKEEDIYKFKNELIEACGCLNHV